MGRSRMCCLFSWMISNPLSVVMVGDTEAVIRLKQILATYPEAVLKVRL